VETKKDANRMFVNSVKLTTAQHGKKDA